MLRCLTALTLWTTLSTSGIAEEVLVHARVLHVRDEPDASSDVTARLEAGDRAPVLEARESWVLVGFHRGESYIVGWVASDWVTRFDPTSATPIGRKGRVSPSQLNVRSEPTTQAQVVQVLPGGSEILVLAIRKRWYKVRYGAETPPAVGWVHANYIAFPKPESKPTPRPPSGSDATPPLPVGPGNG